MSIYPPGSQLLKSGVPGYFPPSLGRGYYGDNMVCGEVQLNWRRKCMEKGSGRNGQGEKCLEENFILQEIGENRKMRD